MAMAVTYSTFGGRIVSENRGGTQRDYVSDSLGNTVALMDGTGKTDTWEYWPYGEIASRTGTNVTPFTFIGVLGYFKDVLDKLIYVRARHLRVNLARWQTVDPLWPSEKTYIYVDGKAVYASDSKGLQSSSRSGLPGGGATIDDPCFRACYSIFGEDRKNCGDEYKKCRKKFWWLPEYCLGKLIICLYQAKADLEKCAICCTYSDDETWQDDCSGTGGSNGLRYVPGLYKTPVQEAK